ncbi:MAG: outer membrane beta-barrel protein [Polyangiaceae bacterium]|nr:outer membrane beta-barrel protein [Polyangiaceae bacterium]
MKLAAHLAALAFVSLSAADAHAVERQWQAGAGLGWARIARGDFTGSSVGPTLHLSYGLTDMFNVIAETSHVPVVLRGPLPSGERGELPRTFALQTAAAGVAYTLDVVRLVPYAGLLVGGARMSAGQKTIGALRGTEGVDTRLDLVLALGADYHVTRDLAVGAAVRLHEMPGSTSQSAAHVLLRAGYVWGW